MGKLLKYELRKTLGIKMIILAITALLEVFFLLGLYSENEDMFAISGTLLCFEAAVSIILIGVYGIRLLHKDLNTKQSYMLFMTPNSSYKILGAKVIENATSIIIGGAFFIALCFADVLLISAKYGEVEEMFEVLGYVFSDLIRLDYSVVITSLFSALVSWLFVITLGFFAEVIAATVLNGKKHSSILSFIIFLAILIIVNTIVGEVTRPGNGSFYISVSYNMTNIVIYAVLSVIMYYITAWIMDNKLSV